MKEVHAAGTREFIYSMIWAVVILFFGRGLINSLPQYKIIGTIVTLVLFCVLAFFVLTRYSARFTYEDTGESLRVNRMIGKRNKEIEFLYRDIISISRTRPASLPKPVYNMRPSVFRGKRCVYVVFGYKGNEQSLIFEPSEEFLSALRASVKKSKQK